jgi:hypothetical protein
MQTLLLHNPWVHLYLLHAGAIVIALLCSSRRPPSADLRPS